MAIDEESFYTVNGDEITRSELVEQVIAFCRLKREVGEPIVTDFNEGSVIRNIIESIAVDLYYLMEDQQDLTNIAFVETADGEWLDKHGANPFINLPRETGEVADGYVVFSIPEVSTVDVVIPEGTVVYSEESGLEFVTDIDNIIPVGETSVTATVSCLTEGEDGNAEANTVTLIDDDNLDNVTVNNPEDFTGGLDYEEDDEYRERLMNHTQRNDFGSLPYYMELGNNITGVHDVYLIDTEEISPGGKKYTKKVLVNGDVKPTSTDLLAEVLTVFTDTNNIVEGHIFSVGSPIYVDCDLRVELTVEELLDETEVKNVVTAFFDGGLPIVGVEFEGLDIGEGLYVNSLIYALEYFDGVVSVSIFDGEDNPLSDIVINENEVLMVGDLTINQTLNS